MSQNKGTRLSRSVYLGSPVRTPIGKFGGSLAHLSAPELATLALKECIARSGGTPEVNSLSPTVFLGHARQAGSGPNPARQASCASGLSLQIPALTLNQACASGMTAIFSSIEKILSLKTSYALAGGTESMSNTPYLLPKARWGYRLGHSQALDGMRKDGFFCPMSQLLMGETVENFIAKAQDISRKDQDAFALESQKRAHLAWTQGAFKDETFSISLQDGSQYCEDEHRRANTTLESLSKLAPVFDSKSGSLTAGNSSGITDGAAFLEVSASKRKSSVAEVLDYETVALDPKLMGLAPIGAIENILNRNGININDLHAIEINEAFAAQTIACQRGLNIPSEKLNQRGGAIALGHPIGASGARVTVTLLHQLKGKKDALGIASLCVSGGLGVALLVRAI